MKVDVINKNVLWLIVAVLVLVLSSVVYSHCQIPCGIYGDDMRFDMMDEHINTIEKSIKMINQISSEQKPDMNQLVRWIENKETHADELSSIITYYFMAQRIKPAEKEDTKAYEQYQKKLMLLHRMLIASMKAKQTADLMITKQLMVLKEDFKKAYYEKSEHKH